MYYDVLWHTIACVKMQKNEDLQSIMSNLQILVNAGLDNGLLTDGTKPLYDPMFAFSW